jgi:hypothetical protein
MLNLFFSRTEVACSIMEALHSSQPRGVPQRKPEALGAHQLREESPGLEKRHFVFFCFFISNAPMLRVPRWEHQTVDALVGSLIASPRL